MVGLISNVALFIDRFAKMISPMYHDWITLILLALLPVIIWQFGIKKLLPFIVTRTVPWACSVSYKGVRKHYTFGGKVLSVLLICVAGVFVYVGMKSIGIDLNIEEKVAPKHGLEMAMFVKAMICLAVGWVLVISIKRIVGDVMHGSWKSLTFIFCRSAIGTLLIFASMFLLGFYFWAGDTGCRGEYLTADWQYWFFFGFMAFLAWFGGILLGSQKHRDNLKDYMLQPICFWAIPLVVWPVAIALCGAINLQGKSLEIFIVVVAAILTVFLFLMSRGKFIIDWADRIKRKKRGDCIDW